MRREMAGAAGGGGLDVGKIEGENSGGLEGEFAEGEVAELGYTIEHCALGMFPLWQSLAPGRIASAIRLLGAERCIMTTDGQMDFNPPPPEMLRMFIATMLQLGVDKEDIEWMVKRNPAKLAGLED